MSKTLKIVLPLVLTAIIVPLIGLVYNGVCEDIETNEKKLEEKVDNKTLQLMLEKMEVVQTMRMEQQKAVQKKTDEHLDKLYKEIKEIKEK